MNMKSFYLVALAAVACAYKEKRLFCAIAAYVRDNKPKKLQKQHFAFKSVLLVLVSRKRVYVLFKGRTARRFWIPVARSLNGRKYFGRVWKQFKRPDIK